MKNYIDTHGHLNSEEFLNNLDKYINNALKKGVKKIIIPGTNEIDSLKAIEISKKYENIYAMVALHPNYSKSIDLIN
jgi:TatD DNase family protein